MAKFIISTDSCADYFKSEMQQKNIYCVPVKRINGDQVFEEIYDSEEEYNVFYEGIRQGSLSSTSQINADEFLTYFNSILEKEKEGDIVHVALSSGLSGTYNGAVLAAIELNEKLKDSKIYVVDSLGATAAMMMLVDKLVELNGKVPADKAVKTVEEMRDNLQVFFTVDDLGHLKRGGRISAAKALIGTALGVKPILTFNKIGKLVPIAKAKGQAKALQAIIEFTEKHAPKAGADYAGETLYIVRTSHSENYDNLKSAITKKYPKATLKEVIVGPVIGSHVGCGTVGFCFVGKPRLDIAQ